jgi:hypothetical protein
VLSLEPVEPLGRVRARVRLGLLRQLEEVLGVAAAQLSGLARCVEPLVRILADRLQHPETLAVADADEALVDERLQHVQVGVAHGLGGLERTASGEDREPGEQPLLVFPEELVAPLNCRAERLLARIGSAARL